MLNSISLMIIGLTQLDGVLCLLLKNLNSSVINSLPIILLLPSFHTLHFVGSPTLQRCSLRSVSLWNVLLLWFLDNAASPSLKLNSKYGHSPLQVDGFTLKSVFFLAFSEIWLMWLPLYPLSPTYLP